MSHSVLDPGDIGTLKYIITHVFCPLQLPDMKHSIWNDHSLARAVAAAARLYSNHVDQANLRQWHTISRMLENLQATSQSESLDRFQVISQFSSMEVGGKLLSLRSMLETHNVQMSSHCVSEPKMRVSSSESRRMSPSSSRSNCPRTLRM